MHFSAWLPLPGHVRMSRPAELKKTIHRVQPPMHPSVHNQPPLIERLMCQCAAMTDVRCERPRAVNGGSHSASVQRAQCASVSEGPLCVAAPFLTALTLDRLPTSGSSLSRQTQITTRR